MYKILIHDIDQEIAFKNGINDLARRRSGFIDTTPLRLPKSKSLVLDRLLTVDNGIETTVSKLIKIEDSNREDR